MLVRASADRATFDVLCKIHGADADNSREHYKFNAAFAHAPVESG
jgi:hypothetical protein